ncbi:MAG: hypothetical protein DRR16_17330 [Candidatus Parabeggiatoa sp. nov. 3]|jgi:hypothetical protein|nr:MAG: hypothetical protein DRQ99_03135 [Gammaproteobacteria bacterium]RKZ83424.1 MAG: hypothetical protein DRR16_17330 [Gammaproteobacteria bacterium]
MKKSHQISTEKTFEIGDRLYMAELKKRLTNEQSHRFFANSLCHVGPYIDNQATRSLLSKAQANALTELGFCDFESKATNKRLVGLLTYIREKSHQILSDNDLFDECSENAFQSNVIFFMILTEEGEALVHWLLKKRRTTSVARTPRRDSERAILMAHS